MWWTALLGLIAAIVLSYYQYWLLLGLEAAVLALAAFILPRYRAALITALLAVTLGSWFIIGRLPYRDPVLPEVPGVVLEGQVNTLKEFDGNTLSFILKTNSQERLIQKIRVSSDQNIKLEPGVKIIVRGDLKPPKDAGNPGEFDYRDYLNYQNIYYTLFISKPEQIELIAPAKGLTNYLNRFSNQAKDSMFFYLNPEQAAILQGMVLGQREFIDPEQYADFQKIGIAHVFAVSGMNVGFLLLLCAPLLEFTKLSPGWKFIIAETVILLYASLVGWPVSITRAVIMASLGLLAHYLGRKGQISDALGLAGVIILLLEPGALFSASFQLSFLATWGLIFLFPLIKQQVHLKGEVANLLLIPICAELAIIPVIAYHFNMLNPVSWLANVLTAYLVGASAMLGFVGVVSAGFGNLAAFFWYPAGFMVDLIVLITDWCVNLPYAYQWVATPSWWSILAYYAGLGCLAAGWSRLTVRKEPVWIGTVLFLVFFCPVLVPASWLDRGKTELVFLSVGQGDSILCKTPQGRFFLVDGGGSRLYDPGERSVLPYLHHRGIRKLYMVINTHPDWDHLGGLITVIRQIPVNAVGISGNCAGDERYKELLDLCEQKEIPVLYLKAGDVLNLDKDLNIQVIAPDPAIPMFSGNEQSVVLMLQHKKFSALLTGDIEGPALERLIQHDLNVQTVLKVPHHGSRNSLVSQFYKNTQPHWAVISVGTNLYGHPHQEVMDHLLQSGISVLRTDEDGAISFLTDGTKVKVKTFISRPRENHNKIGTESNRE